jgi:prepilin-type processing-associated H-X9-DG protein
VNPDALNALRESPHIGGLKTIRKRTEFTVNVGFADGSIGRKSINEPVEALKLAI